MTKLLSLAILLALPAADGGQSVVRQTVDRAPAVLAVSSKMPHDSSMGESWTYGKPKLDLTKYPTFIIDPTVIHSGANAQFADIPPADRQKLADILTQALNQELGKWLPVVSKPGANTTHFRATLLGAETTKEGVATASRVMRADLAMNAVKGLRGKEGTMTGSMLFAIELMDGRTGDLQVAAVDCQP